jgi:prepilin-type N-terminal cleavage/methylation domain-containing protein
MVNAKISRPGYSGKAFTLIELLVVIAIISILVSMLQPALRRAMYQARLATCQSNLKQISIGALMYGDDFNDWYPTEGLVPCRTRSYDFPVNSAYKTLSSYYGGSNQNTNALTWKNDLFSCPQGSLEAAKKKYYSLFFDLAGGTSYTNYSNGFPSPRQAFEPQNMMRRLGDTWTAAYVWNSTPDLKFNILASDVCGRFGNSGGAMMTNHIWQGDRKYGISNTAAGWGSLTGEGTANYAMDDGSVTAFEPIYFWEMADSGGIPGKMIVGGGTAADTSCVPAEWGK